MRILIDECVPAGISESLIKFGHACRTVQQAGLSGKKNGELLSLAETRWDILLTNDKGVQYQQNLTGRKISVLVLRARSNRLADLLSLIPACEDALRSIKPGQVVEIGKVPSRDR